jgi:hypothetical protein
MVLENAFFDIERMPLIINGHRYWLENQTDAEPFVFVMYDTKAGQHARCKCISFAKALSGYLADLSVSSLPSRLI